MAEKKVYVIYLDENGKETGRKVKGRGKPPKERDKDGNFIVRAKPNQKRDVTPVPPKKTAAPKVEHVSQAEVIEETPTGEVVAEAEVSDSKVKTRTINDGKASLDMFGEVMLPLRVTTTPVLVTFHGPVILGDLGFDDPIFAKNNVLARIDVDLVTKSVSVWDSGNLSDRPNVVVRNGLLD